MLCIYGVHCLLMFLHSAHSIELNACCMPGSELYVTLDQVLVVLLSIHRAELFARCLSQMK